MQSTRPIYRGRDSGATQPVNQSCWVSYLRRKGCSGGHAESRDCRSPVWERDTRSWPRTWSLSDCTEIHWLGCRSWSPHRLMPSSSCPSRPYMTRRRRNWGKNTPFYTLKRLSGERKSHSQRKTRDRRVSNRIQIVRQAYKNARRTDLGEDVTVGFLLVWRRPGTVARCALLSACSKTALL